MIILKRSDKKIGCIKFIAVSIIFLLAGFSTGLYYTINPYGREGIILFSPVCLITPFLYYLTFYIFSSTYLQGLYWTICFLITGWFWITLVWYFFSLSKSKVALNELCTIYIKVYSLFLLPIPFLIWKIGFNNRFSIERFFNVVFREEFAKPDYLFTKIYAILCLINLIMEFVFILKLFLKGKKLYKLEKIYF